MKNVGRFLTLLDELKSAVDKGVRFGSKAALAPYIAEGSIGTALYDKILSVFSFFERNGLASQELDPTESVKAVMMDSWVGKKPVNTGAMWKTLKLSASWELNKWREGGDDIVTFNLGSRKETEEARIKWIASLPVVSADGGKRRKYLTSNLINW